MNPALHTAHRSWWGAGSPIRWPICLALIAQTCCVNFGDFRSILWHFYISAEFLFVEGFENSLNSTSSSIDIWKDNWIKLWAICRKFLPTKCCLYCWALVTQLWNNLHGQADQHLTTDLGSRVYRAMNWRRLDWVFTANSWHKVLFQILFLQQLFNVDA